MCPPFLTCPRISGLQIVFGTPTHRRSLELCRHEFSWSRGTLLHLALFQMTHQLTLITHHQTHQTHQSHAQVKLAAYPSSQRHYQGLKLKLLVQSLQCSYQIRVREMDGSKMARYGFISLEGRIPGEQDEQLVQGVCKWENSQQWIVGKCKPIE